MRKTHKQQEQDRIFFEVLVGTSLLVGYLAVAAVGLYGMFAKLIG